MKLRCLLVDDEPRALKVLQSHMAQVNGIEIVALCKNAIEAMDILHQKPVDLVFLDIKMPKISGTEFLKGLSHPPKVIFVTAYREFAVEGYDLEAIDYLVKPVSFERFLKAISRAKRMVGHDVGGQDIEHKANFNPFVYLKVDKHMQKIFVNEILYIESWKDYIKLYLSDGSNFLVKQSISSMEILLSEHKFLRVHRSYLVAVPKISGYNALAVHIHSKNIPIGRLYKQKVLDTITTG